MYRVFITHRHVAVVVVVVVVFIFVDFVVILIVVVGSGGSGNSKYSNKKHTTFSSPLYDLNKFSQGRILTHLEHS